MSFLAKLFRRSSASTNTKENSTANVSSSRSSLSYQSRAPCSQLSTSDDENVVSKINMTNASAPAPRVGTNGVWINVILDESGSMRRVADDTIASFNNYINKQKEVRVKVPEEELVEGAAPSSTSSSSSSSSASPQVQGSTSPSPSAPSVEANETKEDLAAEEKASCFVSLTKFDAPKIKDVYNRTVLAEVPALSHDTYKPAGGTNLLDAMGHVIGKVDNFLTAIESVTDRPSVLVVILTDGQENMSRTYNRETIKALVESRTAAGWMFVFLGANIDAWGTAAQYGINKSNAFNFSVDRQHDVMDALNESTEQWRNVSKAGQMRFKKAVSERPESCEAEVNAYAAKQSSYSFFSSDVRARKESRK